MGAVAMAWFWQVWLAAVVFLFPIPHTIALRNLLLLTGVLALLGTLRGQPRVWFPSELRPAAWALSATTVWLVLHSVVLSPAPKIALDNLRGDWIVPLLTGALAAYAAARLEKRLAIRAIVAALMAHLCWMFLWQLWFWLASGIGGAWPSRGANSVPFGNIDYHSTLSGFLLALLLGERLAGQYRSSATIFPALSGWGGLLLALIADVALRVRNGTIVNIVLLVAAIALISRRQPRMILLIVAAAVLGGASFILDTRWNGLKESLTLGLNSSSLYWQTSDVSMKPSTPSGAPLEESAYVRAAWARQAISAIVDHPMGLGFGRDGFGRAVTEKFGFRGMVSSHSGWLDFALAVGLPGLAMLLLSAALTMQGGWRIFRRHNDTFGLMLSFFVCSYLLRCLVDGHLSGWRLGLFSFICGVLVVTRTYSSPRA